MLIHTDRKFSNKGATPYRGPPFFGPKPILDFWTFLAISQPKMVRLSICKKPLVGDIALSLMKAPPVKGLSYVPGASIREFTVYCTK